MLLDLRVARVLRVLVVRTVCRVSRERWACQDPPVYPALLESREPLVIQALLVSPVIPVPEESLVPLEAQDLLDPRDPRVSLAKTVTKALPERRDRLDQLATREVQVPQDLKDAEDKAVLLDHRVLLDLRESEVCQEIEVYLVLQAHLDQRERTENPVLEDHEEKLEPRARQERLDHQAHLEK